jgi:hypothetical protein
MIKLTIAIPSKDRLSYLRNNIFHSLSLPDIDGLDVKFCISAASSTDGSKDFLRSLAKKEPRLIINIKNSKRTRWNWIYLAGIIPHDSEWVWLFGDDDIIVDPTGWGSVLNLLNQANEVGASIVCIPQAKRVPEGELIYVDSLINIAGKFGFHDALGWMTSILMRRSVFMQMITEMRIRFKNIYTDTGLLRTRASPFFHSLKLLEQNAESIAILALQKIVDEQISVKEKKRHTLVARQEEHLRERLPFTFTEFKQYIIKSDNTKSLNFYRYVNKTFIDVFINIISEDILNGKSQAQINSRIKELKFILDRVLNISQRPYTDMINTMIGINQSRVPLNYMQRLTLQKIYKLTKEPYLGDFIGQAFIHADKPGS